MSKDVEDNFFLNMESALWEDCHKKRRPAGGRLAGIGLIRPPYFFFFFLVEVVVLWDCAGLGFTTVFPKS